jgi:arylsulfatase A-like enzyme
MCDLGKERCIYCTLKYRYCALMIMLDEAIGRTVCALEDSGLAENMLLVVASDNGALTSQFPGTNYPFRGGKGGYTQVRNRFALLICST